MNNSYHTKYSSSFFSVPFHHPPLLSPPEHDAQVQGALLVLSKYVTMLHEHVGHIMPTALHVAQISPQHFHRVGAVLLRGPMGVVLPEISLGLVVLQLRMPLLLQASNTNTSWSLVAH